MQLGGKGVHHADGRRGLFITLGAAGVAVAQKLIIDIHFHRAVAQAGLHCPIVQRPVGLHIRVEAAGGVYFITHQCAFDPQFAADEVLIAVAAVLALVEVQAADQGQITRYAEHRLHPAQAATVEFAIELHYTATLFVAGRRGWNRQILNHTARAGIGIDLQGRVTDIALVVQAQLLVVDAFPGVIGNGVWRYRARVGLVGFPALAQRVLGAVLFKAAVDQRQFAVFIRLEVELGKGLVAARSAVFAVAVGVHARGIQHKADVVGRALGSKVVLAHAVAAHQGLGANARRAFAVAGEHLDHAAGIAAVQGGCRAAQHFDTLGGVEVERRRLPLAVRGARRDAIGNQFDATHAKCRAGAKAAGRDLQVLGVVLTVLHHQSGYAGQHF